MREYEPLANETYLLHIARPEHPYFAEMVTIFNSYEGSLWDHPERVFQLESSVGFKLLALFLERACQCQNWSNICVGRLGIAYLPRAWVLANIETVAEPILHENGGDDWEWRRLLEVYDMLHSPLMHRLAQRALVHPNSDIREVGRDFRFASRT